MVVTRLVVDRLVGRRLVVVVESRLVVGQLEWQQLVGFLVVRLVVVRLVGLLVVRLVELLVVVRLVVGLVATGHRIRHLPRTVTARIAGQKRGPLRRAFSF